MTCFIILLGLVSPCLAQVAWRSGDTHVHQQACSGPDLTLAEIQTEQKATDLDFAALQLWARWADIPEYLSLAPLVTGLEAAPGIQYGVEVSGFPASQFGHLQILSCADGDFPTGALHSGPIFAYYDSALCGYAHVSWPESYDPRLFFGGLGAAYLLPIDAALREADFLESMRVAGIQPSGQASWRGMAYKLWSCGLRLGLAAGSDNTCADAGPLGDPRTWAVADTYAEWCTEIREGRTSISDAGSGRVELSGLTATIEGGGAAEILANGVVVASGPSPLTASPPAASCWLAARTVAGGSHTAPSWWIVDDEPVAVAQDAAYWRDYCTAFEANIGVFGVPEAEAEIVARIRAAKDIYTATYQRTQPWPVWASEYGTSTPACHGPISIGLSADGTKVDCLGAPSSASGWLLLGFGPAALVNSGITVLVNVGLPYVLLPVVSSEGGYASLPLNTPVGKQVYCQWIFASDCGSQVLCASDGMAAVRP